MSRQWILLFYILDADFTATQAVMGESYLAGTLLAFILAPAPPLLLRVSLTYAVHRLETNDDLSHPPDSV